MKFAPKWYQFVLVDQILNPVAHFSFLPQLLAGYIKFCNSSFASLPGEWTTHTLPAKHAVGSELWFFKWADQLQHRDREIGSLFPQIFYSLFFVIMK